MRVALTTQALERVADIEAFVGAKNPQAAAKISAKIMAKTRKLEDLGFARLGRKVPELDVDDIREVLEGNYRILYRIHSDDFLEVITIFDGRQQEFPFDDVLDGE